MPGFFTAAFCPPTVDPFPAPSAAALPLTLPLPLALALALERALPLLPPKKDEILAPPPPLVLARFRGAISGGPKRRVYSNVAQFGV